MTTHPSVTEAAIQQSNTDRLRLVALSHFFLGGVTVCLWLCAYVWMFGTIRVGDQEPASMRSTIPLPILIAIGACLAVVALAPVVSGFCILARKFRWLSIIVSIVFLPFFPIGTTISIYSLATLTSAGAQMAYRRQPLTVPR